MFTPNISNPSLYFSKSSKLMSSCLKVSKVEGSLCLLTEGDTVVLKRLELNRFELITWLIGEVLCNKVFSLLDVCLDLGFDF